MSIISKYYIDLSRLNEIYNINDRIADHNIVAKIIDSSEWKQLDKSQKILIFNTLIKFNILVPYDKMEQNASNSPTIFFYNNEDNTVTEKDFEDDDNEQ